MLKQTNKQTNKYISIHVSCSCMGPSDVIIHFGLYSEFLMCSAEQIDERCSSDQYKYPPPPPPEKRGTAPFPILPYCYSQGGRLSFPGLAWVHEYTTRIWHPHPPPRRSSHSALLALQPSSVLCTCTKVWTITSHFSSVLFFFVCHSCAVHLIDIAEVLTCSMV